MDKKELIKKYGENMRELWQIVEALLDDTAATAWQEGYDEGWDAHESRYVGV